jgi:hypothetical protein
MSRPAGNQQAGRSEPFIIKSFLFMKKFNTLILSTLLLAGTLSLQAQRYLQQVFTDVNIQTNVQYGLNYTIITVPITGHSAPQPLTMDVYTPAGDTETERPLILYFRTGNFLPNPQNLGTTGTKNDSIAVELCTRLAKMGYVVANVDYRLGWNPASSDINVRISTLINAAWRGVQDSRVCMRFFRKSVAEQGNPFGICPDRITLFGEGTGGYISLASSTLDQYLDIVLPKFIGPDINGDGVPDPFVIEPINGDLNAETILGKNPLNGDTLSLPNHPGYSSEAQLCVNLGGALGDISWLDASDPPTISYHVPNDPNAPYTSGILIVPTTGDLIVEVQGSYEVAKKSNTLGVNDVFKNANIQDAFTTAANANNDGYEGLFPFLRPTWTNPLNGQPAYEGSPWSWWDAAFWSQQVHPTCTQLGLPVSICNYHVLSWIGQQDMSATKGRLYADSIIGYFAPRAYAALHLGAACGVGTNDLADENEVNLTVAPNPAAGRVWFTSEANQPILGIQLYNLSGQLVKNVVKINTNVYGLEREGLINGMYIAKVQFASGIVTRKISFN